jgi:hypothetical protein
MKHRRVLLSGALIAVALAAAAGAATRSVVVGTVLQPTNRPTCAAEAPCTKPAVGIKLTFMRAGSADGTVVSKAGGAFSVDLGPGTYLVKASDSVGVRTVHPARIITPDSGQVHRTFVLVPRTKVQVQGAGTNTQ